ncbi:MAG: type II secretion system protein [Gallionella sp.]|nr:type II secretion system protein [Gallionella sp.]
MNNAEKNYQIIRQLEDGRNFMLEMYAQNPALLKTADSRIRELFEYKPVAECERPPKQRGASLIELIMFIVIVSVALAGILLVMNQTTRGSADPLVRKQALAVAYSLLEEVELQDFANPVGGFTGANVQANRSKFDDVMDYNGFNQAAGIYSLDGVAPITGLEGYTAGVTVIDAALGVPAVSAVQIDVTVTAPNGEAITATGYRAAY